MAKKDYKKLAAKHMNVEGLYDLDDIDRLVRNLGDRCFKPTLRDRLQKSGISFRVTDIGRYVPSLNPLIHGMGDDDVLYPRATVNQMFLDFWPSLSEDRVNEVLTGYKAKNSGVSFPASNGRRRGAGYVGSV